MISNAASIFVVIAVRFVFPVRFEKFLIQRTNKKRNYVQSSFVTIHELLCTALCIPAELRKNEKIK